MRSEVKNSYAHVTMQGILNKIIEMDFFVKVRKPKADWHAIDSPKMRTKEIGFFAMTVRKYFKLEISISSLKYFQTVKQKKNKLVCLVLGRIYDVLICLRFYLTFRMYDLAVMLDHGNIQTTTIDSNSGIDSEIAKRMFFLIQLRGN